MLNPKQQKKSYKPSPQLQRQHQYQNNYHPQNIIIRNQNINPQLISNFTQIKQSFKQRKLLFKTKHAILLSKNQQKIIQISQTRGQDLKALSKNINDPFITNLIQNSQSLMKYKQFLDKLSQTNDIIAFIQLQALNGKRFWDKYKQHQKQRKKKLQLYTNLSKKLQQLNTKQQDIFTNIEQYQNQIINLLIKYRDQQNQLNKAQKCNQDLDKQKYLLNQLKKQKYTIKNNIITTIDQILQINQNNQQFIINRQQELKSLFIYPQHFQQLQYLMDNLQKIINSKSQKSHLLNSNNKFQEIYKNYDILVQQLDRLKQQQDKFFTLIHQELKQHLKNAFLEKSLHLVAANKQDYWQLLKKYKQYKKLIIQLSEEKPKLKSELERINQLNKKLFPQKTHYQTQQSRKQDLKQQIKKLCKLNQTLQSKQKQLRNFQFYIDNLLNKRKQIQTQINFSAQKANLHQFKTNLKQLQTINQKMNQKKDESLKQQIYELKNQIQNQYNYLYDQFSDLINQLQINQQSNWGTFLNKLEKRLSLI